jgi:hypothetical protein
MKTIPRKPRTSPAGLNKRLGVRVPYSQSEFEKGMRIETSEHHLPRKITAKLVRDHLDLNPKEYARKH